MAGCVCMCLWERDNVCIGVCVRAFECDMRKNMCERDVDRRKKKIEG